MREGKVLINVNGTVRDAVEILINFAQSKNADVIVASTHSRGTVERLFMGSFAESLMLQSSIPVGTVNPHAKVRERIRKVLFPSPLTKNFRQAFEIAVRLCKNLDAGLTLYYKEPFIPMLEASYEFVKYMEQDAIERKNEADRWREWAAQSQVPVELCFDARPGNVADEISGFIGTNNFDLVIMVSQTTDVGGPRVGSICRKVVRGAACPVLMLKTSDYVEG
jgi:nucleotide-binding universal stress UspA family protein